MSDIFAQFTLYINHYGLWLLGLCIILQCHGFPSGANFMVIASGALAALGELNPLSLVLTVVAANIIGDLSCYLLWKGLGNRIFQYFPGLKARLDQPMAKTADAFERYGFLAVLLTRFPVSALAVVMNIAAGTANCRFRCFAPAVVVGETIWTAFYVGIGYWFGDSWEAVYYQLSQFSLWVALGLGLAIGIYLSAKHIIKTRPVQLY